MTDHDGSDDGFQVIVRVIKSFHDSDDDLDDDSDDDSERFYWIAKRCLAQQVIQLARLAPLAPRPSPLASRVLPTRAAACMLLVY